MFRFTIRDVLWLTVVVALTLGWWIDHRTQATAVSFYREANEYWRGSVESTDKMLKEGFGFEIEKTGNSKSYIPPRGVTLSPNWPKR